MKQKLCLLLVVGSVFLTGCEGLSDDDFVVSYKQDVIYDTDTEMMDDSLETPSLTQELTVKDEPFSIICDYEIDKNTLENWHITDTKHIGMSVCTKDLPDGYEAYIDHAHLDISLVANTAQINGILQDSMDDTYHGYEQPGFFIDNNTSYYNVFNVDGYTENFYQLWGLAFGDYGIMNSSYRRLTERNLLNVGVFAEKLSVVYDISIKKPDSDKFYTKSVLSEILIPVSKNIQTATVTNNYTTGERTVVLDSDDSENIEQEDKLNEK